MTGTAIGGVDALTNRAQHRLDGTSIAIAHDRIHKQGGYHQIPSKVGQKTPCTSQKFLLRNESAVA